MSKPLRVAGVLGGMGPAATIDFATKVLRHSQAGRGPGSVEQDDVRLLIDSNPAVPDRNAAVAGGGPSPGPMLADMARGLVRIGADFLVMPCNAAHAFADDILAATPVPFVSLIDEAAAAVLATGGRRVGILAVAATAQARLYERALEPLGIACLVPSGALRDRLMNSVWRIKRGDTGEKVGAAMRSVGEALVDEGAELIVAACTEVPLALAPGDLPVPMLDTTDILARRTVDYARGEHLPQT